MKTTKLFILTSALMVAFAPCKKEQIEQTFGNNAASTHQLRTSGDVTFCSEASLVCEQNGVLVFPDINTLQKVTEDIEFKHSEWQANGKSEQAEFKISIRFEALFNYTSLRSIIHTEREIWLNNVELDLASDPDDKWVEGIGIRTLINSNGAIKIGNSIYVVKPFGETFEITDGNFSTLNLIVNGQTKGLAKTIIHKADGSQIDASNGNVLKAADECDGWMTKSGQVNYKSNTRRLKGKVWVHNLPFYANIGSESENFKKSRNNWNKSNANSINTSSAGTLYDNQCKNFGTLSIGKTRTNKKDVQETRTYWNQVTKSKPGQYGSGHSVTDANSSASFTL